LFYFSFVENSSMMENPFQTLLNEIASLKRIVEEIRQNQDSVQGVIVEPEILDVNQAAQFLGISKSACYNLVSSGILPYSRPIGTKKLYFFRSDLFKFIEKGKKNIPQTSSPDNFFHFNNRRKQS
jgi:excisionase family DNA binding protein